LGVYLYYGGVISYAPPYVTSQHLKPIYPPSLRPFKTMYFSRYRVNKRSGCTHRWAR